MTDPDPRFDDPEGPPPAGGDRDAGDLFDPAVGEDPFAGALADLPGDEAPDDRARSRSDDGASGASSADETPADEPPAVRGRVVSAASAAVEPLYATSRLLRSSLLDVDRMKEEAERRLQDAEDEARRRLDEAEDEARRRREAIDEEVAAAREQAAAEARAATAQEFGRLLKSFHTACEESYRRFPEWVRESAFKVARHVVDTEFLVRPEQVKEFVERALSKARRSATSIQVHPDDLPLVEPLRAELIERHGLPESFQVVESEDVARHSVRVETGMNRAAYHLGVDELFAELRKQVAKKTGG